MALDFFLTHFYRLVVHDVVLLSDVYWFYTQERKEGKSIQEFTEILSNLLEVESQNFEEINTAKLSIGEGEGVLLIIWDYFHDVVIKHLLDDVSQFPFWASKVLVTSQPHKFGMPVIKAYVECITDIYQTRGVRGLFQGCAPYCVASGYYNYKFLLKATHSFIHNVFSKIPHPDSESIEDDLTSPMASPVARNRKTAPFSATPTTGTDNPSSTNSSSSSPSPVLGMRKHSKTQSLADLATQSSSSTKKAAATALHNARNGVKHVVNSAMTMVHNIGPDYSNTHSIQQPYSSAIIDSTTVPSSSFVTIGAPQGLLLNSGGGEGSFSSVSALRASKKAPAAPRPGRSVLMKMLEKGCVALMTQPLLVLSYTMVTNPLYHNQNCFVAFFSMTANNGLSTLYRGLRSRVMLSLLPLTPLLMLGIADTVIYRRIAGQGTMDSTGGIVSIIKQVVSEGSVLNLLNYGLLTALNVLPGFLSFVSMRSFSWLLMGSSLQRKHQITRRQDIISAHINLINKKLPYE